MESRGTSFFDLSDRFSYGSRVVPDGDLRRIFANCYVACRENFQDLDSVAGPGHEDALDALLLEAGRILAAARAVHLPDPAPVQRFLGGSQPLTRTAALLQAIAARWKAVARMAAFGETVFDASNGERFHVTPVPVSSVWDERDDSRYGMATPHDDATSSLSFFHAGVHVTPVIVATQAGDCTIERRVLPSVLRNITTLKIAVCPMTPDQPNLRATSRPSKSRRTRFIVEAPNRENEGHQIAFLERILTRCQEERVSILVLPELRVSPAIRAALVEWLRELDGIPSLACVVAGSWHVEENGQYVNRCDTIGPRGDLLWRNDKLAEYEISADVVAKDPDYWKSKRIGEGGGREDIRRASRLAVVDTPIGRLTTAICAGFFMAPAEAVMKASGANLFFVPAMSPKTADMVTLALQLARYRAGTFLANCAAIGSTERSFWRVPIDDRELVGETAREAFRSQTAGEGQEMLIWECPYALDLTI